MVQSAASALRSRGRERIRSRLLNQPEVALYQDGRLLRKRQAQKDQRVFVFEVSLSDGENIFEAVARRLQDGRSSRKMTNPRSYKLSKKKSSSATGCGERSSEEEMPVPNRIDV